MREELSTTVLFQPGERSCNRGAINKDGDLLFILTEKVIVGYNLFTEKCFQIYEGHDGAIEDLAVSDDSKFLLSVGNSQKVIMHHISSGEVYFIEDERAIDRACCLSSSAIHRCATVSSGQMRQKVILSVYNYLTKASGETSRKIEKKASTEFDTTITSLKWIHDRFILAADEKGRVFLNKFESGKSSQITKLICINAHRGCINNMTMSYDGKYFTTASSDTTASVWSVDKLIRANGENEQMIESKNISEFRMGTYHHSFIVSCAAMSPIAPHIVLASSDDQKRVASTNSGSTDYTINFFNTVFEEEFAAMKVHKSTVNWVGYTPDGYTIVTTSHEGTTQLIRLGGEYEQHVLNHNQELDSYKKESKPDRKNK